MQRLGMALGIAAAVTTLLFFGMAKMIANSGTPLGKSTDGPSIEFIRLKQQSVVQEKKRDVPKKPDPPKEPPKMNKMNVAKMDAPQQQDMKMDGLNMEMPLALGNGPYLGGAGGGSGDAGVMPLVRIEPQYPRKAAMNGTEGWVKLKFDITPVGTVTNVAVIESKPRRIFDRAARRALLKWKYKPRMEEGKPVAQKGLLVQLDFKLEN